MGVLLVGGIALTVTILITIFCRSRDYPPYAVEEHISTGIIGGLCTFFLITMFSVIICSTQYDNINIFNNRNKFINSASQIYYLEEIQKSQFVILNMDNDKVNFIYQDQNNMPVMCTIPVEMVKIYTNVTGEPAMVRISTWELRSWYAKSFLNKNSFSKTTYEIYLPGEVKVISSTP